MTEQGAQDEAQTNNHIENTVKSLGWQIIAGRLSKRLVDMVDIRQTDFKGMSATDIATIVMARKFAAELIIETINDAIAPFTIDKDVKKAEGEMADILSGEIVPIHHND